MFEDNDDSCKVWLVIYSIIACITNLAVYQSYLFPSSSKLTTSAIAIYTDLQCRFTSPTFAVAEGSSVSVGVQLVGTPFENIQKTIQCVAGTAGMQKQYFCNGGRIRRLKNTSITLFLSY